MIFLQSELDILIYWIRQREWVRKSKAMHLPRPLVKMLGSRAALSKHKQASSLRGAVKITARKADEL